MNYEHNAFEQIAYGHATSMAISAAENFSGTWYEHYKHLADSVANEVDPGEGWVAWQPFEYWEWKDIVEHIENEAESLLDTIRTILSHVKTGIVRSAIHCTLDEDMNNLDLEFMTNYGVETERAVTAGKIDSALFEPL